MRKYLCLSVTVALGVLFIYSGSAKAAPALAAAEFYKGKTIMIAVPSGPGGGNDVLARLYAPFLEKYTGATVVVKNMPGGGAKRASNWLYVKAKRDGLHLSQAMASAVVTAQLVGDSENKCDLKKTQALCNMGNYQVAYCLKADSPFKSIDALKVTKRLIKHAAITRCGMTDLVPICLVGNGAGVNVKTIYGFSSGGEQVAAVLRGEVDACVAHVLHVQPHAKAGTLRPLFVFHSKRVKILPDVPTFDEFVEVSGDIKLVKDYLLNVAKYHRFVIAPPDVSKEKIDFLRHAFDKAFQEKRLVRNISKIGQEVTYIPGVKTQKDLEAMLATKKEIVNMLKAIFREQ